MWTKISTIPATVSATRAQNDTRAITVRSRRVASTLAGALALTTGHPPQVEEELREAFG